MEKAAVLASGIFVVMYLFIVLENIHRTIVAMIGAILMVLLGVISQDAAIARIDFNMLGLLIGLMFIVAVTAQTGLFRYLALWLLKKVKANVFYAFMLLSVTTALFSALVGNTVAVIFVAPLSIAITARIKSDPVPGLLMQIVAANIGGMAAMAGSLPQGMLGGMAKELTFHALLNHMALLAAVNFIVVMAILFCFYRRDLTATGALRAELLVLDEKREFKDMVLLKKCLCILALTVAGFLFQRIFPVASSTIALAGAFVLLLLASRDHGFLERAMEKVEWPTIFFFIGLFVTVGGLIETGVIEQMLAYGIGLAGDDAAKLSLVVLWFSAVASSVMNNVTVVTAVIPVLQDMGISNLEPLWQSLALGACLGGNGSIIGASANLVAAGMAAEKGQHISYMRFFKIGFPVMLLTVMISTVYLYFSYLA